MLLLPKHLGRNLWANDHMKSRTIQPNPVIKVLHCIFSGSRGQGRGPNRYRICGNSWGLPTVDVKSTVRLDVTS